MGEIKYNTKHSNDILVYLQDNPGVHLTAQEICRHLNDIGKAVGLTTVYRQIERLVESGLVNKYVMDGSESACFEYLGNDGQGRDKNCFHCKCLECGKLIHLECDEVKHLLAHIEEEHGFKVDISKVTLYGICPDCQKGENK